MDLTTFVKETVKSIIKACEKLENNLNKEIKISPHNNNRIDFDVAITTEEKEGKGLSIAKVFQVGINKENLATTYNRIQFSLYVSSKTKEEEEKYRQNVNNLKKNNF
jgi:hypothetical protein